MRLLSAVVTVIGLRLRIMFVETIQMFSVDLFVLCDQTQD